MQLQQVERLYTEVLEAALDEGREVFAVVARRGVRIEPAAGLGGDVDRLAPGAPASLAISRVAAPVAVDVRRVDEVDAQVDRLVRASNASSSLTEPHSPPTAQRRG